MIEVNPHFNLADFFRVINNLEKISDRIYPDLLNLGERGYDFLKRFIPISKLNRPHLRDSFKVYVEKHKFSLILYISTNVPYAMYVDSDAFIPTRYPKTAKAMRFIGKTGEVVFAKRARGFYKRGIHFISETENWLAQHLPEYVDLTFRRYLS